MSGRDFMSCVSIEETDPLFERVRQLEVPGDESSRKDVAETRASLRRSDQLLEKDGKNFLRAAQRLAGVKSFPAGSPMRFIKEILPSEAKGVANSGAKALVAFADEIEKLRLAQGGLSHPLADVSTLWLDDIKRLVETRDQLLEEYRLLIAEMYRQSTVEEEYAKRLNLGRQSILVDVINQAASSGAVHESLSSKPSDSTVGPGGVIPPLPPVESDTQSQFPVAPIQETESSSVLSFKQSLPSSALPEAPSSIAEDEKSKLDPILMQEENGDETTGDETSSSIPCVSNPKAFRRAGNLQLTWDWPDGIAEAAVLWRNNVMPRSPDDKLAEQKIVSRTEYDKNGAFIIASCGNESYRIAIFSIVREEDAIAYSSGVKCVDLGMGEKTKIKYRFRWKRKWFLFGQKTGGSIVISSPGPFPLPELVVIKKRTCLPLDRNDGILVCAIKGASASHAVFQLALSDSDRGFHLKVFAADPSQKSSIIFNPPPFEKSRV